MSAWAANYHLSVIFTFSLHLCDPLLNTISVLNQLFLGGNHLDR